MGTLLTDLVMKNGQIMNFSFWNNPTVSTKIVYQLTQVSPTKENTLKQPTEPSGINMLHAVNLNEIYYREVW